MVVSLLTRPEIVSELEELRHVAPLRPIRIIIELKRPLRASLHSVASEPSAQAEAAKALAAAGVAGDLVLTGRVDVHHLLGSLEIAELHAGAVVEALPEVLLQLAQSEDVLRVERETVYTALLDKVGQSCGAFNAYNANVSGAGVTVAVVDTGIDANHPGFGTISSESRDFTVRGQSSNVADNDGHGTHVAGIVGGDGSPGGTYRGIAPGSELMILKVVGTTGEGLGGDVAPAFEHAIKKGADVINFSLGESPWDPPASTVHPPWVWPAVRTYEEDIYAAPMALGTLVVVAAGNNGDLQPPDSTITKPAIYDSVLSVGCVDRTGTELSGSSARGPVLRTDLLTGGRSASRSTLSSSANVVTSQKPDLVAPGGINDPNASAGTCRHPDGVMSSLSSSASPAWSQCAAGNGIYTQSSGTSMAAAVVSGIAALGIEYADRVGVDLRSRRNRAYILKRMLISTAVDLGRPREEQGAGMVSWDRLRALLERIAVGGDYLENYEPV